MPKLKDSRGNFHKSYTSLHAAEVKYMKEAAEKAKTEAIVKTVVTPHKWESELERAIRQHKKRPRIKFTENDSIIITETKREKEVIGQEFYCLNCGEGVTKTDVICPTCGIPLDWRNL